MATEVSIAEGLFAHLAALVLSPVMPIAWPNEVFPTPPAALPAKYLRANELPTPTRPFSVGNSGSNDYTGIFQVDVMWPQNDGLARPLAVAGAIISHFKRGTVLYRGGVKIKIMRATDAPALKDDPRMMIPVSINYQAFAPNV